MITETTYSGYDLTHARCACCGEECDEIVCIECLIGPIGTPGIPPSIPPPMPPRKGSDEWLCLEAWKGDNVEVKFIK